MSMTLWVPLLPSDGSFQRLDVRLTRPLVFQSEAPANSAESLLRVLREVFVPDEDPIWVSVSKLDLPQCQESPHVSESLDW